MNVFVFSVCFAVAAAQTTNTPHHDHDHGDHWHKYSPSSERVKFFEMMQANLARINDQVIDDIHEFRFEYHNPDNGTHLLIAISDKSGAKECHFVEIDPLWEPALSNEAKTQMISEELYAMLHDPSTVETTLTVKQLQAIYGDTQASKECWHHTIKVLHYTPSQAVLTSPRCWKLPASVVLLLQ